MKVYIIVNEHYGTVDSVHRTIGSAFDTVMSLYEEYWYDNFMWAIHDEEEAYAWKTYRRMRNEIGWLSIVEKEIRE